jgi:homeobox protein cut-like
MELKKELQERPTQKMVDDLKKKVQILQVLQQKYICVPQSSQ